MKTHTTKGWILKSKSVQDNKLETIIYTDDFGKIYLKVQGAQKMGSKLLVACDAYKEVELVCSLPEGSAYGRLISIRELKSFDLITKEIGRFIEINYLSEMLDSLTPFALPNRTKYSLFKHCMAIAGESEYFYLAGIYFLLNFLKLAGQGLQLDVCVNCRGECTDEIFLTSRGLICKSCKSTKTYNKRLGKQLLEQIKVILHVNASEFVKNGNIFDVNSLIDVMNFLLPFYLPRPLKVDIFKNKMIPSGV
ncbi:MAG: DNA repair protein RecO [bacterium]